MSDKEPVFLTILIDTSEMKWRVGGISLKGQAFPLLTSCRDDLAAYRGLTFDEQTSFLRHRFCGVLQRGCDRLWGVQKKACHFLFVLDANFPDAPQELTIRTADHLVQWMTNPPVVFFRLDQEGGMVQIAGEIGDEQREAFQTGLTQLQAHVSDPSLWEEVPPPRK